MLRVWYMWTPCRVGPIAKQWNLSKFVGGLGFRVDDFDRYDMRPCEGLHVSYCLNSLNEVIQGIS